MILFWWWDSDDHDSVADEMEEEIAEEMFEPWKDRKRDLWFYWEVTRAKNFSHN